ncbi:MAG: hypothetical protein JW936_06580 [Sedimentisphaerales bacterium]|nr:hypothetical protein [Sedimentisphaerales bacterium]
MRRIEQIQNIARECVHFKGDRPCLPHARGGASCRCKAYCPRGEKILIVELTSAARVVQSSALVERLKVDVPDCHITYLTSYPELLNASVDVALPLDAGSVAYVQTDQYDRLYNLDMNRRTCAITNLIHSDYQKGFYLRQGNAMPVDEDSQLSYLRRVLPGSMGEGYVCPMREMFQNCGLEYRMEMPRLTASQAGKRLAEDESLVVLWGQSFEQHERAWPEAHWVYLVELLRKHGVTVLLAGTAEWHGVNSRIAKQSDAAYCGAMTWGELLVTINSCDAVVGVSDVSAALAVALGKAAVRLEHSLEKDVLRDRYRDRVVGMGPTDGEGRKGGIADVLPDQVFNTLRDRLALPESRKEATTRRCQSDMSDWLDVVMARAETAEHRVKPWG